MFRPRRVSDRSIFCLILVVWVQFFAGLAYAGPGDRGRPGGWPNLSGQFQFGFEPTHSNVGMLVDIGYFILKKAITGRGKGVLEIEGNTNSRARLRYLELLRRDCPECVISEARESHGTISYRITYPDRSTIGSSLDAGALEWQNSPLSVDEIHFNLARHQKHMFDLPRQAGAWLNLDAFGGHVTESGYDDALFWLASLKLDAETPVMSWGFFGKDGYNATPVKRWASDQQVAYQAVIREYEGQWESFLKRLEALFADANRPPSSEAILALFADRRIMDQKVLVKKLAEIYKNPNQESRLTGARSKPKYVAHRPAIVGDSVLLIENRAIRPQKEALDLELMARYRLRRAEFIKYWLDRGYDVDFTPGYFEGWSNQRSAAQAQVFFGELGLPWSEYAHLGPVRNPQLDGSEVKLSGFFKKKSYGVARRNQLYQQVLDSYYLRSSWSSAEWTFVLNLTKEHGNTVALLENELRRLSTQFKSSGLERLPLDELEARTIAIQRLVEKYRVSSPKMFAAVRDAITPALDRLWRAGRVGNLSTWVRHLSHAELMDWAQKGQGLLNDSPKTEYFDLQAALIDELEFRKKTTSAPLIREASLDVWVSDWFRALKNISTNTQASDRRVLPRSLREMCDRAQGKVNFQKVLKPLADYWLSSDNRVVRDSDEEAIEILAREFKEHEDEIVSPLRKRYWQELELRNFGETAYYEAVVYGDKLLSVTSIQDRENTARELLGRVRDMHARVNSPDSKSFVERIENELRDARQVACQATIRPEPLRRLREFLLNSFHRL